MLAALPLGILVGPHVTAPPPRAAAGHTAHTRTHPAPRRGPLTRGLAPGRPLGDVSGPAPAPRDGQATQGRAVDRGSPVLGGIAVGASWVVVVCAALLVLRRRLDARRDSAWSAAWESLCRSRSSR